MTQHDAPQHHDASWGDLSNELTQQLSRLVRDEIRLAQVEIREKGTRLGRGARLMGVGGVLALFGFGCLVAAAVVALDLAWATWLAAVVVGGILLVVAGIAVRTGRGQMRLGAPPVPSDAIASTKEDIETLKGHH
jgi:uncharacterized membrane protein YqjE